jgi:hypothetical protein
VLVGAQLSVPGLYLPPVLNNIGYDWTPPQTIISLPVHTAVCTNRGWGALMTPVGVQTSVLGLYRPPVLK